MRVMISMDTHTHVDGASKVHTIKRYLSEHKDDGVVNNSSLRCRELDYLRAYYYVAILNFLKESCFSREETIRETKETESSESGHPLSCDGDKGNEAGEVNKNTDHTDVDSEDSSVGNDTIVQDYNLTASKNSVQDSESGINENVTASHCVEGVATLETGPSLQPQSNQSESSLLPVSGKTNQKHSLHRPAIPVLNVNHYVINITLLTRLAHGLLWDIQAKKFALTETLGYIHKAISQLLLSKNSQPLNKVQENETGASEPQEGTQSIPDPRTRSSEDTKVKGCETGSNIQGGDSSFKRGTISSENVTSNQGEGAVAKATEKGDYSSSGVGMVGRSSRDEIIHFSEHHFQDHHHQHHHELHMDGHVCHEVLSHHFDHVMNIHVPHVGEVPIKDCELETETEIKYSFFDVCSSCEVLHKSRKILFDDEPQFYARPESGFKDVTNITNPAKYINVPDEWYGMPVDQKYFKRYVTMAILKDEQEYVMTELKRAPDCTQALFPSPLESVRSLVEVAGHSSHISTVERQQLAQKVIMWALNFACTSQQKQNFLNLLQAQIEH
ncbi:hypothetical protein DPMN_100772 [Dreissena polymorpha]|uniref:Uncharacterized protein n=2 Tax=Dreissena polymorpha TaxID=45954 RepID=A0A9D4R8Z1_DREPO|nr:hypothetical protein DPMN_100772 [Dreissena polymorpha]